MTWILWPISGAFAIVLAAATWLTVDTVCVIRRGRRLQHDLNQDNR